MAEFHKALKEGEIFEFEILNYLKKRYPKAYKVEGKFSDYDIYIPEIDNKIEVKYDKKSHETGNIVVEIEMFGRPTALLATKSDYWFITDGVDYILITPEQIKDIIIWNELKPVKFVGEGDTHKKRAFLIKKELIWNKGLRINIKNG